MPFLQELEKKGDGNEEKSDDEKEKKKEGDDEEDIEEELDEEELEEVSLQITDIHQTPSCLNPLHSCDRVKDQNAFYQCFLSLFL